MTSLKIWIIASLTGLGCAAHAASQINFDFDWRFHLGDVPEASAAEFDDKPWRQVDLPHYFSIESDFNRSNLSSTAFLPGGIAWYRKTFTRPPDSEGHWVSVEFDGVSRSSQFWLNGHRLGEHGYGYTSFSFDLTPFLKSDGPNVLAVRVDRSRIDDSRWYPGSGIIRRVWLETYEPLHIARHGVYVTTPEVGTNKAVVRVQTTVRNESAEAQSAHLVTQIAAPDGHQVLSLAEVEKTIPAGGEEKFDQSGSLSDTSLWSLT